jgi:hypothetical protein
MSEELKEWEVSVLALLKMIHNWDNKILFAPNDKDKLLEFFGQKSHNLIELHQQITRSKEAECKKS